jgi:hypothetical protein
VSTAERKVADDGKPQCGQTKPILRASRREYARATIINTNTPGRPPITKTSETLSAIKIKNASTAMKLKSKTKAAIAV